PRARSSCPTRRSSDLIEVFERYDAPVIATMQVEGDAISRFGVIDAEEVEPGVFKIKDMVEKPALADAPSDLAIIGRYIFTPDIRSEEHTSELQSRENL